MEYSNKPLLWGNEGTEPTEEEKQEGFAVLDKVPAPYFNYFLSQIGKCIEELQNKLSNADTQISGINKESIGLGNVDNTKDSEKAVKFASEAGVGRKVQYELILRLNGGKTEGTDQWTFDGSTSRSVNITADKIGAAKTDLSNVEDEVLKEKVESVVQTGTPVVVATSTDGVTYTATVEGLESLQNGYELVIIPNMTSTSTSIVLDVNGWGGHSVRLPYSFNTVATGLPELATFYNENHPVKLIYSANDSTLINGTSVTGVWKTSDKQIISASYLSGITTLDHGGTGVSAEGTADLALQLNNSLLVNATSTDGATYTATIDGVTELNNGMQIIIIPNMTSTSNAITLNLNGLGAKGIRQPLSFSTFVATSPTADGFLRQGVPCRLMYHATYAGGGIWLMADKVKYSAQDLYGTVPVESGGTGVSASSLGDLENQLMRTMIAKAYSTDGTSYTVTIEGITELYDGLTILIKPTKTNAGNCTLNLNNLGDVYIVKEGQGTASYRLSANYFITNNFYRLMYNFGSWLIVNYPLTNLKEVDGTLTVGHGGTGATKAEDALKNLGKPTGSYTGGNSTESRTVAVGGIGTMLLITSDVGMALVSNRGAICLHRETAVVQGLESWKVNYNNGTLTIATDSEFVNGSQSYWWQVL